MEFGLWNQGDLEENRSNPNPITKEKRITKYNMVV